MEKSVKVENFIKYGVGAILIGIGGFASLFLIKSIVALAVVSIGSLLLWNFLPVIAQWAAQMQVKGIKYNSAKNPVEDLQLLYIKKQKAIEDAGIAITSFAKEAKDYKDKLDGFIQRRPEKAEAFKTTYNAMKKVLDIQTLKLRESRAKLAEFEGIIIEAEDIWQMTQAAMKANKAMRKFDAPNPMDEIRQRTALDSVIGSLNQVTAELETAVALDYNSLDQNVLTDLSSSTMIPTIDVKTKVLA
jgi:hypothetical protein